MTSANETLSTHSCSDYQFDHHSLDNGYADILHQSYQYHHHLYKTRSRLSMCISNSTGGHDAEDSVNEDFSSMIAGDDVDSYGYIDGIRTFSSLFSIQSFDVDDEEFSDEVDDDRACGARELYWDSDDDKKTAESSYHSMPETPLTGWIRKRRPGGFKDYASENEDQKVLMMRKRSTNLRRRRRRFRRRELERRLEDDEDGDDYDYERDKRDVHTLSDHSASWKNYGYSNSSFSGESENGGGGPDGGLMVITRPKGGRRSLCLDLEEVKACRDLGFELDHEHMFEIMPSRISLSTSTLDTATACSSGGNSPNWFISSPGDDPKDVKARLKVWAQAVALASTSTHGS